MTPPKDDDKREDGVLAIVIIVGEPPAPLRGLVEAVGGEGRGLGAALLALGWNPQSAAVGIGVGPSSLEIEADVLLPKIIEPLLLDEGLRGRPPTSCGVLTPKTQGGRR